MDVNVAREEKEKCDKCFILSSRLQRLYPQYKFDTVPIVIGSTGYVPKSLQRHLQNCGVKEERIVPITRKLQRKSLLGSVKIVKTALKR